MNNFWIGVILGSIIFFFVLYLIIYYAVSAAIKDSRKPDNSLTDKVDKDKDDELSGW